MSTDLPMVPMGHAAPEGCHRTQSGVATHVLPGCECAGPRVEDEDGNVIAVAPDHVNLTESNGKTRTIKLEQARTMGLIA